MTLRTTEAPVRAQRAGRSLFGAWLPRIEDDRLLAGQGTYVADVDRPRALEVAFVRSQVAHGAIRRIDTGDAEAVAGVVASVTAVDLSELSPLPDFAVWAKPVRVFPLARERVRYVGSPVAAVVATDRYIARLR